MTADEGGQPGAPAELPRATGRSKMWVVRDLPALLWLTAAVLLALGHFAVADSRWLLFHLLLLGAAGHSILVWSRHFTDAVLHTRVTDGRRRTESWRLIGYNAGVTGVLIGVVADVDVLVLLAAGAVAAAVLAHVGALWRRRKGSLGARFGVAVGYYLGAAALLPVGVTAGVLLQRGLPDPWYERVRLAHVLINLYGWVGITVLGTLITLWPTILRTRIADTAVRTARRSLVLVLIGVVAAAATAVLVPRAVGAGLLVLLAGWLGPVVDGVKAARRKPPSSFAGASVAAGVGWLLVLTLVLAGGFAVLPDDAARADLVGWLTPGLAVGFLAQVLGGALAYLVPMALGGGPGPVRAASAVLDRGAGVRLTLVSLGLAICLLPVPSLVRIGCSVLVLVALMTTLGLLVLAIRTSMRLRRAAASQEPEHQDRVPAATGVRLRGGLVLGTTLILLAAAGGVVADPVAAGLGGADVSAGVAPTGHTTEVEIEAAHMRFTPNQITVPRGDTLVLHVRNTDPEQVHDLVLASGATTGRLAPGGQATIEIPVVGQSLDGWCSIVGHRQLGMTLRITVTGDDAPAAHGAHPTTGQSGSPTLDPAAAPAPGFAPFDARLAPAGDQPVHRITLTVTAQTAEIAPGIRQERWTYNGTVPGPTLRGKVGDRFEITLINKTDMGHSIDFHAGERAPDEVMRTIPPGQSLTYVFLAQRAGIWLYHCSSMPMSAHIAAGMFGAVIIDPPGLAPVDREYLLVDSEAFLSGQDQPVDAGKAAADQSDLFLFNGYAFGYDHAPLTATVGERVRIWVLAAGPNRGLAFHVVGGQFDTVYAEGSYLLRPGSPDKGGSQVLSLDAAQGGFVELTFAEPGHYPFVDHRMSAAERGAHGIIVVTPAG